MVVAPTIVKPLDTFVFTLLLAVVIPSLPSAAEDNGMPLVWEPGRLYTHAAPYRSLFVEVDFVERSKPTERELSTLRLFLETHCDKPDGIAIQVDEKIELSKAKGRSPNSLSLEFADGPGNDQQAYIYILFFNHKRIGWEKVNTHTMHLPYPSAILVNRGVDSTLKWFGATPDWNRKVMIHELAHVIGLGRNRAHGDGSHCSTEDCLLNAELTVRLSSVLPGKEPVKQNELCSFCLADAKQYRSEPPADNIRFMGPLMVRSEDGYQVVSLPGLQAVFWGDRNSIDGESIESLRNVGIQHFGTMGGTVTAHQKQGASEMRERVPIIARDPNPALFNDYLEDIVENAANAVLEDDPLASEWVSDSMIEVVPNAELQSQLLVLREILDPPTPGPLSASSEDSVYLSDFAWDFASVGWGSPTRNHYSIEAWRDNPYSGIFLRLGDQFFSKGLYAHSKSQYVYALDGQWIQFSAIIGLQKGASPQGSAIFSVHGDGNELFRSVKMRAGDQQSIELDVAGVSRLELRAEGGGNHVHNSWAIWAEPIVSR